MTSTRTDGRQIVWAFVEHEHQELIVGIDRIRGVAEGLASLPADRRSHSVATVLHWIDATLKPHMAWEESWLCPQIHDRAQAPWVARLVAFDHRQVADQAERLKTHHSHLDRGPSSETMAQVFGDLVGLEVLLRANLEREEYFLLPMLEREADQ